MVYIPPLNSKNNARKGILMKNEIYDEEMVQNWLCNFFDEEIKDVEQNIANEKLWEKGHTGAEPNSHPANIINLQHYLAALKELKAKI